MKKNKALDFEFYDVFIDKFGKEVETQTILDAIKNRIPTEEPDASKFDVKTVFRGINNKMFIRLNSKHLLDYFKAVSLGNTSYVTYLDDTLDEYRKTGKLPLKSVSVLYKNYYGAYAEFFAFNEEVASRVGNIIGVPVVYNKTVKGEDILNPRPKTVTLPEVLEEMAFPRQKEYHNVSIDYMKYGDTTYDSLHRGYLRADSDNQTNHRNCSLKNWFHILLFSEMQNPHTGAKLNMVQRRKLTQDFIPSYLFRKFVLSDADFDIHNIMIEHNTKTDVYSLAPNFDMERSFRRKWVKYEYDMCLHQDLEFAYRAYPEIIDKFVDGVKRLLVSYKDATKDVDYGLYRQEVNSKLKTNAESIIRVYEIVKAKALQNEGEGMPR